MLNSIHNLEELRKLSVSELHQIAKDLRQETINVVSKTGGHLGAGLGVVELTVALHYVFNTPQDLLIWDIGHQSYPHKILTDRKNQILTLRQAGGISGFTKRSESIFDPFGAGHSSTSISAALGMAIARDLSKENKEVIAVIGDGAMSAGMAFEAMNNAGSLKSKLIVILNDNDMSIAPPVGALNTYLSKLISSKPYLSIRKSTKNLLKKLPHCLTNFVNKSVRNTKDLFNNGNFFEEMGFYYLGPIDGHDIDVLVEIFKNIRDDQTINQPILVHIVTEKGKGFVSPEQDKEKYHAVSKFDLKTGKQNKTPSIIPTYTEIFGKYICKLAEENQKIVAITAAMPSGTGLSEFAEKFPDRFFDVGIAEQHAVTFAAGLACEGFKPFVAIYSTFLQRAYDQVVHDVSIQNLPVVFAIDRAGFVGADGPTHAGSFDITYLATLPNFVVMAPSDENELAKMIYTAATINQPCAFRYPRGNAQGVKIDEQVEIIPVGKGRIVINGEFAAILNFGTKLNQVMKAAQILADDNINITVADARFAKPLDFELINQLVKNHKLLITIEEGSSGGFGSQVLEYLSKNDLLSNIKIKILNYPDKYLEQNTQEEMDKIAGLTADDIVKIIRKEQS